MNAPAGESAPPAGDLAAAALDEVGRDPKAALQLADAAVAAARRERDPAAAATAHRSAALAWRELGDLERAGRRGLAGVRIAMRGGAARQESEARMTLAFVLLEAGRVRAALHQADRAAVAVTGLPAARVAGQRAMILQRVGRVDEALTQYARALPVLRRHGDRVWEARLLNNRGMAEVERGMLAQAATDFSASRDLLLAAGKTAMAAGADWNLGLVAARRGDVPLALSRYDAAQADNDRRGTPLPQLLVDRAEVLLSVGLGAEAVVVAEQAVEQLTATGQHADRAQAVLVLAQALSAAGDPGGARQRADEARQLFIRQHRDSWATLARLTSLSAAERAGADDPRRLLAAALRCADAVRAAGWPVAELEARLLAARAAGRLGDDRIRISQLRQAAARRRVDTLDVRLRVHYARALLHDAEGDRRAGRAALAAGLRVLDEYHALLGATELRITASVIGVDLAATGLAWAMDADDARQALRWADRGRSRATRPRPVRPPRDAALTAALAEVRRLQAQTVEAQLAGAQPPTATERRTAERVVVSLSRKAGGWGPRDDRDPGPGRLAGALGPAVLLEFVEQGPDLAVVVVRDGRFTLHRLGRVDGVTPLIDRLHFALRRLAAGVGSERSRAALRRTATGEAGVVADTLLTPVRDLLADRGVVLVPSASLHAVPWAMVPGLDTRPVRIAPSAASWYTAAQRRPRGADGRQVFVAGPGLPGATAEVIRLADEATAPVVLAGGGPDTPAVTDEVLASLDGAALAHIAAHGRRRADNPLFSAVLLADGPLTMYDLEGLAVAPEVVVLSSCESASATVRAGDELVGLVSALLSIGTRTVVATGIETPDAATTELMVALHRRLRAGDTPAAALPAARAMLDLDDPTMFAAAAGFLCFGA